jgi:hypothetical protein
MQDIFDCISRVALALIYTAILAGTAQAGPFVGAVYAGLAGQEQNALVAYGGNPDGTLTFIGKFLSAGAGGHLNGGAGSDPLVAADSVLNVDNRYILHVNAGSNNISSYRVNDD